MNTTITRIIGATVLCAATLGSTALTTPALAKGGHDDRVEKRGSCSVQGTWKLKAKHDDSRLEIEAEVDSNRTGQVWSVRITDNGRTVFSGPRTTAGRSGSFSVERKSADLRGTDVIRFRATYGSAVCTGTISV